MVSWAPQNDPVVYAYRYPETNLSTYTQLLVYESQQAILFSKGQMMGKFGPGKHTLNTENLPILRSLYGLPFGKKNPFLAEVWFVNLVESAAIPWNISNVTIHDADYNNMLPIAANGQYGLRVVDPELFLKKVVGVRYSFSQADMTKQFTGEFSTKVKSALVGFMTSNNIGLKRINAFLDQLSTHLREAMNNFWNERGIELTNFYVSDVGIDESTGEGRRVKQALHEQTEQAITGHTWQQSKMFETANSAIDNFSSGQNGLLGGLMAINMMGGMGGGGAVGAGMMQPAYNQPSFAGNNVSPNGEAANPQAAAHFVYCANCAKKFMSNSGFCPHCGHQYNPCPRCGTDNDENARRCISCGTALVSKKSCPKCGNPVAPGAAFCGSCGQSLGAAASSACSRCGAPFGPNDKFCGKCGNRR